MIVFDLKCRQAGHIFEGWFASGDEFERQKSAGLLLCPICGDTSVTKAVMAPAVAPKSNQREEKATRVPSRQEQGVAAHAPAMANSPPIVPMHSGMDSEKAAQLMETLAKAQAEALSKSEWVGRHFADKARAMHYGEEDHRAIHGEVDIEEARTLVEEGVEVAPLLFPVVPAKAQH